MALVVSIAHGGEGVVFDRDVRPILSNHCYQCHGPDDQAREADLRLDLPEGLFGSDDTPAVVIPGELAGSLLWQRISSNDPDEQMPPKHANKPLRPEHLQVLRRWIEEGAAWQRHWAFIAPTAGALPPVKTPDWCRTPVDRFILSRLEARGLHPSQDAAPEVLVRRLFLDLVGLPPDPYQAARWEEELRGSQGEMIDEAGLERLVDYLLASPHYGQRWAQRWLDLARYADTNGYEKDRDRSIWPYRDWVIQALNDDMPFDRFTIEQLAGDLLPDATVQQRIATGFHRNTMLNEEGGIDPLEFRFYAMNDRVSTTGAVWLGLTLGCAQCHSHKFDPVTQTEYYRLMALMNNTDEPELELPDAQWQANWERNQAEAERLLAELPKHWPLPDADSQVDEPQEASGDDLPDWVAQTQSEPVVESLLACEPRRRNLLLKRFNHWHKSERAGSVVWQVLEPVHVESSLPILTIQPDYSIFASGDTAKRDDYYIEFAPLEEPIRAIRLEALPDERLPARGPGSTYYEGTRGDFFLAEFELRTGKGSVKFRSASHSFAANRFGNSPVSAELTLDGDVQTGWSVHGRQGERHVAVYVLQTPIPAGASLQLHMVFGRHFASSLGRFRLSATNATTPPAALAYTASVERALLAEPDSLDGHQWLALFRQFLIEAPELKPHSRRIIELRRRPPVTTTLVMSEWPEGHRRPTYRHHRGEYLQRAEQVEPGTPAVLHPWQPQWPKNRMGLALWLTDSRNPLTARVVVNRAWADLFDVGLVKTQEDFGLQGEAPSHPELLDWLAVQFSREFNWSFKKLHRLLVTSRVYRQEAAFSEAARDVDPQNRLLSFMPRKRLTAEQIRDQMLATAGCLDRRFGGPPVRPLQAAGISEVAYGNPKWQPSAGGDRFRRSIYTYKKRTAPFAFFATFDAPSGESCTVQRVRSSSPLQALSLLNDVMVMELAQHAALRESWEGISRNREPKIQQDRVPNEQRLEQQLAGALRRLLIRGPTDEEIADLKRLYLRALGFYAEHPQAAQDLLAELRRSAESAGEQAMLERLQGVPDAQMAAWIIAWRAMWSLEEAITCP